MRDHLDRVKRLAFFLSDVQCDRVFDLTKVCSPKVLTSLLNEIPIQLYQFRSLSKIMEYDMILEKKCLIHLSIRERMFIEDDKRRVHALCLLL